MSGDQMPSLPGRKKRQMPWICPGGGMFKLRFDWYIISKNYLKCTFSKSDVEVGLSIIIWSDLSQTYSLFDLDQI